jgi:hypothetical protein
MSFKGSYGLKQGQFRPSRPEKYNGTVPIEYRSSYELNMMIWLDRHEHCVSWASESDIVPYYDPVKKTNRRYFIDFRAVFNTVSGTQVTYYIEVKPYRETFAPKPSARKKQKTLMHEQATWITNCAKWEAATTWARKRGGIFKIVTEKELYKNM